MAKKTKNGTDRRKVTKKTPAKKTAKKTVRKKTAKKVARKAVRKTSAPKRQSASVIKGGSLRIGDKAPEFKLQDQNGNEVSLSDFRGRNIVVYFYPRAMTPGCTVQACGLRDVWTELKQLDVVILGISGDSPKKLKQFEVKQELNFILLSDEDHAVANAYHSWGPKKFMGRTFDGILRQSFFIDGEGKIINILHKVNTASHHETVLEFFKDRK